MRRPLLVIVVTGLLLGLESPAAHACSMVAPPPTAKQRVDGADKAIYGRVISIEAEARGMDQYTAKVRVLRIYKGRVRPTIRIRYTTQSAACGTTFNRGDRVGLLLYGRSPYWVSHGNRITLRALNRVTGGKFRRPR